MEYKSIKTDLIDIFERRELRQPVLEKLKERISSGFNPARPLTVVKRGDRYLAADGNHRLHVLRDLGIGEAPCVIRDGNPYRLAIDCNADEETYAPEDLFDRLDTIRALKEEGRTQQEIGDIIGVSRNAINDYQRLLNNVDANILGLARICQVGRASENDAVAPFNFTEGWFRNSGLYSLNEFYQNKVVDSLIADKFNWSNDKLKRTTEKYRQWQVFETIAKEEAQQNIEDIISMIRADYFKSESSLRKKIEEVNKDAENRLINGDAVQEIQKLDNGSIDILITDPPYGINYKSNRSQFTEHITKTGVASDTDEAFELFKNTLDAIYDKLSENALIFVFTGWQTYSKFEQLVAEKFDIKNMIIWDKGNHGAGDLDYAFGNRHEQIIFASKGNRKLVKRIQDIIAVSKVNHSSLQHPTEKPEALIKTLLDAVAHKHDVFCDPFMGSGSHVSAAKKHGCRYIGIEIDTEIFKKAKHRINE
jgi:site-specific DNA-methyltransferase (adenine-specific)